MDCLSCASSRRLGSILLLGLALACAGPGGDAGNALPSGPHPIALIVLDGVRADSIDGMPFLGSFAGQAVRFDWAFAQSPDSVTSLASTLTGLYPTTHGLVLAGERLTDDALTLAELLREARMSTAAFVHMGEGIGSLGLEQGFDTFETGPGALDAAASWLAGNGAKGLFLLAATDAVSVAAGRGDAAGARQRYDEALAAVDRQVRALVEKLGESATVVVLSTAGSELGDVAANDGPTLHAARMHVPLLIRLPRGAGAQEIDKIVELIDLPPTILELTGTSVPLEMQGASLLPLILGGGTPPYIAFGESPHYGGQQFAVLGGYRLILSKADDRVELYALSSDPLEATDLAGSDARRVEVLRNYLAAWEKMIAASSLDPNRRIEDLDDATLEQLKSLGYIQ